MERDNEDDDDDYIEDNDDDVLHQHQQEQQQQCHQRKTNHHSQQQQQLQQPQQQQKYHHQIPQLQHHGHRLHNRNYDASSGGGESQRLINAPLIRDIDFFLDSASRSSGEQMDQQDGINHNQLETRNNFRYSPETTDYDSNCGDLDSKYKFLLIIVFCF